MTTRSVAGSDIPRNSLVELESTLIWLRWCMTIGLAALLVVAHDVMGLSLDFMPLWMGVVVLIGGNAALAWRMRRASVTDLRVMLALSLDLAVLAWLLYWSGGTTNPFVMLFLVPIALTASVLTTARVIVLAVAASALYGLLMFDAQPLPVWPGVNALAVHFIGMWITFMISLVLLTAFALRMASRLEAQRKALVAARARDGRERTLLTLALQAAGTAHEINTPLSTMATVVDELRLTRSDDWELTEDLAVLAQQLELCRCSIRALGASARGEAVVKMNLDVWLRQLVSRWRIVRPRAQVAIDFEPSLERGQLILDISLSQTVLNLFDNALDASLHNGREEIELRAFSRDGDLELRVRDFGNGFAGETVYGVSNKPTGLGLGLLLSNTCLETLGGSLNLLPASRGGTEAVLHVPSSALLPEQPQVAA